MYKITVTKEDIAKGKPEFANSCAIARAIRRVVGKKRVEVDAFGNININHRRWSSGAKYGMIRKFVDNFDDPGKRRYCRPFSFILKKDV